MQRTAAGEDMVHENSRTCIVMNAGSVQQELGFPENGGDS